MLHHCIMVNPQRHTHTHTHTHTHIVSLCLSLTHKHTPDRGRSRIFSGDTYKFEQGTCSCLECLFVLVISGEWEQTSKVLWI